MPRSFIWQRNTFGSPTPAIVCEPRAGSLDIKEIVKIKLEPDDARTLEQLARDYPVPGEIG